MDVSLAEILLAREERVKLQAEISKRFQCPIISFTMNIAGPQKNSPLIKRSFNIGLKHLCDTIGDDSIIFKCIEKDLPTGPLAIFAVKKSASELKRFCVETEEKTALGRLFDIDVIDESFQKISRDRERSCIVCNAPGRACAAGRLHSLHEIIDKMNSIMTAHVFEDDANKIADLARQCLIQEVKTTPKPGLVDLRNNGSHTDMTAEIFERSANVLFDYFVEFIRVGRNTAQLSYKQAFLALRKAGIKAESCMYSVTGGINTHKGAIFSFGLLCGAIGRLWTPESPISSTHELLIETARIAQNAIEADLMNVSGNTAGERMYIELGSMGIRGEVASGFRSVQNVSLPVYRSFLDNRQSKNDAGVITLLHLIANVDDTAIYNRGGIDGLKFAKEYAKKLLENKKIPTKDLIEEMDEMFIQKNLSAGGSADLLAVTYFIYEIEKLSVAFN